MTPKETRFGSERGVSPVVGVILMVAITVILAAVIAAFTMGIADFSENPQAALDISEDTDSGIADVQVVSNDNSDYIYAQFNGDYYAVNSAGDTITSSNLSALKNGTSGEVDVHDAESGSNSDSGDTATATMVSPPQAGQTISINVSPGTAGDEVTVIGEVDGNDSVLDTHTIQTGS